VNTRLNENFVLRVGQTGILTDSPDQFGITFWNMKQDSRCPQGVVCVWAGEVRVEITFQENGVLRPPILELTTTPNDPKHTIAVENYHVELVNVEPPNVVGKPIARDEYAATFRVTREVVTPTPVSNAPMGALGQPKSFTHVTHVISNPPILRDKFHEKSRFCRSRFRR